MGLRSGPGHGERPGSTSASRGPDPAVLQSIARSARRQRRVCLAAGSAWRNRRLRRVSTRGGIGQGRRLHGSRLRWSRNCRMRLEAACCRPVWRGLGERAGATADTRCGPRHVAVCGAPRGKAPLHQRLTRRCTPVEPRDRQETVSPASGRGFPTAPALSVARSVSRKVTRNQWVARPSMRMAWHALCLSQPILWEGDLDETITSVPCSGDFLPRVGHRPPPSRSAR
jgi:hypothetical protein